MPARSDYLHSDLQGDGTCSGQQRGDDTVHKKQGNGGNQLDSHDNGRDRGAGPRQRGAESEFLGIGGLDLYPGDLRLHGVWTDCGVPGGGVSRPNTVHVVLLALPHWKRGLWRPLAAHWVVGVCNYRQYHGRTVLSNGHSSDDVYRG